MTNVFGDGLDYEIDTEEILNEVDAKLKMVNITNDQKFIDVNEFKSEITKLNEKIKSDISKSNEKIKSEYEKFKKEINIEILGYRNKIAELENKFESHVKLFNLLNKNVTKWHGEVENHLPEKIKEKPLKLSANEEVTLEKVQEKIDKIDEKQPKIKYILSEKYKDHIKKKYSLTDEELEIYKRYMESKKKKVV